MKVSVDCSRWTSLVIGACAIALSGCEPAPDSSNDPTADSSAEIAVSSTENAVPQPKFADGTYVFDNQHSGDASSCKDSNGEAAQCLSFEDYKDICERITGITKGAASVTFFDNAYSYSWEVRPVENEQKFFALLNGGGFESVSAKWRDASSFDSASGVKGVCVVRADVSGVYKGTTSRASAITGAIELVVNNGEVSLHKGTNEIDNFK